jgi:tetratricopeptide (TPR) repeat protein
MVSRALPRIAKAAVLGGVFFATLAPSTGQAWPRHEVPSNAAGREALERGEAEEAVDAFAETQQQLRGERGRRAAFNKGNALAAAGETDAAKEAFGEAAQTSDGLLRSDALFNRGLLHDQAGEMDKAVADYRDALLANPDNERARRNLERLLLVAPPPPMAQQSTGGDEDSDEEESEEEMQQALAGEEGEGDEEEHARGDDDGDEREEQAAAEQTGDDDGTDEYGLEQTASNGEADRELTPEQARAILDSVERDAPAPRFFEQTQPPPDYDPTRNW